MNAKCGMDGKSIINPVVEADGISDSRSGPRDKTHQSGGFGLILGLFTTGVRDSTFREDRLQICMIYIARHVAGWEP